MFLLILCMAASFAAQLSVLTYTQGRPGKLRLLSLVFLEVLPLGGALSLGVARPYLPYLGWEFRTALCLWAAGAVFLGYLAAWGVHSIKGRKNAG